jgi:hypothetical protein
MNLKLNFNPWLMVCLLLTTYSSLADPLDDGIDPPPPAPINDYILPVVVVALLLGGFFLLKFNFKVEKK